jgi:hypothetical protein
MTAFSIVGIVPFPMCTSSVNWQSTYLHGLSLVKLYAGRCEQPLTPFSDGDLVLRQCLECHDMR